MTELLARVAGSSVSLNCPCADQGGRHVDMVVGADHRGRAGVGVWRDAASRLALLLDQADGLAMGPVVQAQWAKPTPSVARPVGL